MPRGKEAYPTAGRNLAEEAVLSAGRSPQAKSAMGELKRSGKDTKSDGAEVQRQKNNKSWVRG